MNKELLIEGIKKLGMETTEEQIERFSKYSELLKEWNNKINLTAITDDDGISVKHFLDSILPLAHIEIKTGANIADVGTGADFPGLPIKIIRDDINLTLIDSLNKRINFLTLVSNELNLSNTVCVHGRAEDLSRKPEYREKFDYVISRAVANMTALSEYCLPYIKPGGMFIALKAEGAEQEVDSARAMICNLGGRIDKIIKAPLPNSDIVRSLIVIKKVKPTPKSFPRTSKKIKQQSKPVL